MFLFLLFIFLMYNLFSVVRIQCRYNGRDCPQEIVDKLNTQLGQNSIFINQKKLTSDLKSIYPIDKINFGFRVFNTLDVSLSGNGKSIKVQSYLLKELPPLSIDALSNSTEAADWPRPTQELDSFLSDLTGQTFELWNNGSMTPAASESGYVKLMIKEKPGVEITTGLYNLLNLVQKYLNPQEVIMVGDRVFLRLVNEPDIIVNIPFDEGYVTEALQSLTYLATIKKDAKVIDLRFRNPIIR